jgi:hypothetical protein
MMGGMQFTPKELFALVACAAIGCGSAAYYSHIPSQDTLGKLLGLLLLMFGLLIAIVGSLGIVIAAIYRKQFARKRQDAQD